MADLELQQLQRSGFKPVSLKVTASNTLCLQGASGSGKTLLLRAIADLDPNQGEVTLGDKKRSQVSAHQWRQHLSYVPSESHWWKDSVHQHSTHWSIEYLTALGFKEEVLNWQVKRLSSGERQRLAIVRALSSKPFALLLDEPTANLDPENTAKVEQLISTYQQEQQCPIIWVTHDTAQCQRIGDASFSL